MSYKLIDITKVENGRTVMKEKFWLCKDGDPKQAIFFNQTAQCNNHKQIPERMKDFTAKKTGWNVEIVFVEIAFRPNIF